MPEITALEKVGEQKVDAIEEAEVQIDLKQVEAVVPVVAKTKKEIEAEKKAAAKKEKDLKAAQAKAAKEQAAA